MPDTMTADSIARLVQAQEGVLALDAALVARDWLPPGRRLGLRAQDYDVGERGFICERWLASTTRADNAVGPADEGLSYVRGADGTRTSLAEMVQSAPDLILGEEYARTHEGLGRLAKIFDFAARIPYHIHPRIEQARLVGRNSKDEAYYFPPGVDLGAHPESFFGVHPSLGQDHDRAGELLLSHLVAWNSDEILQHARGYVQIPHDGFYIPSGVLHAPGTALTVELQEDSDTLAMFQALNAGRVISKELLFKDVPASARETRGEAALLDWVDWDANADSWFYENHHIAPLPLHGGSGSTEAWILYGGNKFSGKRLMLEPGARHTTTESGVFNLLAWRGQGTVAGHDVRGGVPGADELLVVNDRAVQPIEYVNTGSEVLTILKFFGPDINVDAPVVQRHPAA